MNTLIPYTQISYTNQEQSLLNTRASRLEYFTTIPWQLFSTHFITTPNASSERRRSLWPEYLNRVRALHRDSLAYLWSDERRTAHGDLYQVPIHFHALWFSNRPLDTRMLTTEWQSLAGVGGKPIEIEPYNSSGDALAYVLKLADRDDCHREFSNNLSLFLPENGDFSNAQNRRRHRRHLARANSPLMTASTNAPVTLGSREPTLSWDQ
jgi:hypothetical protein